MRRLRHLTLALLALGACASSGTSGTSGTTPRRQIDLITRDEIATSGASNALEAVERLRPQFLRPRGGISIRDDTREPSPPQVFVDGMEVGGPEALRDVPASTVLSIHFSPNRDTESRLGSGQYGGVIRVVTGRPSSIPPGEAAPR